MICVLQCMKMRRKGMDEELKVKFNNQVKDQMADIITRCLGDFLEYMDKGLSEDDLLVLRGWVVEWVKDHIEPISKEDYDKEVEDER